jgi:hypothetical protein
LHFFKRSKICIKFCFFWTYIKFLPKIVFSFISTFNPNTYESSPKTKNVSYKYVLDSHFTSISGRLHFCQKKSKSLYLAVHGLKDNRHRISWNPVSTSNGVLINKIRKIRLPCRSCSTCLQEIIYFCHWNTVQEALSIFKLQVSQKTYKNRVGLFVYLMFLSGSSPPFPSLIPPSTRWMGKGHIMSVGL